MKVITFFNNKGGVGKTTLACNIASLFATRPGKKVAVIDCDPQCNATQLILGDKTAEKIYSGNGFESSTLLKAISKIEAGDPDPDTDVEFIKPNNKFNVSLLAGHPLLSLIEDELSVGWGKVMSGKIEGFRVNHWLDKICKSQSKNYDYIFIDVGPSLGSINRSVLLGSDYIVSPMGCDIFSLIGVRNIGKWIKDWIRHYERWIENLKFENNEAQILKYEIQERLRIGSGFIGYTNQQSSLPSSCSRT